jgi:hypothetical protein
MALLTPYSRLANQTSSSRSSDSVATPEENCIRKLVYKFERHPTVESNKMALLTPYSRLAGQTSSSHNSDSVATPKKRASGNSCKNLSAIQRWDQTLWPF